MLRTRRPVIQLMRSTLLFASNATNFFAIIFIPLAKSASISLMAPLLRAAARLGDAGRAHHASAAWRRWAWASWAC